MLCTINKLLLLLLLLLLFYDQSRQLHQQPGQGLERPDYGG